MAWSAGVCLLPQRFADRLESFVFRTTVGLGAFGTLFFALGLLNILTREAVLLAAAAAIAGAVVRRERWELPPSELAVVALAMVPLFALTLYPPASWDDTMYHLPYAKTFAQTGSVPAIPNLRFPVFPQLQEMLYTAALLVSNDLAAQGIHLLESLLLACSVLSFARRFAPASFGAGPLAATALLASPLIIEIGASAYLDVALTLFAQLSMHALESWRRQRSAAWLVTACACAAFAASTKYLGLFFFVAVPIAAFVISRRDAARPLILAMGLAIAIAGPWYLRIYLETGAPLYPLFRGETPSSDSLSASPHLVQTPVEFLEYQVTMLRTSMSHLWRTPWDLSFGHRRFGDSPPLAPIFVILLPLSLVWFAASRRSRAWMVLPMLYAPVWLFALRDRRFLLQALPLLAIAGSCALLFPLRNLAGSGRWRQIAAQATLVLLLIAAALPGAKYLKEKLEFRGVPPVDAAARDRYLDRVYPFLPALRFLNETWGHDYSVFALFCEHGKYYAEGTMWGDWMGPGSYKQIVTGLDLREPDEVVDVMSRLGARYLLLDRHRVDLRVRMDEEFRARFRPVFGRARLTLFERSPAPSRWIYSDNLLLQGGFEQLDAWRAHLRCELRNESVRCAGDANLTQSGPVKPGVYELTLRTRSDRPEARSRLQVNWLAADGAFLDTDIEVIEAPNAWRSASMIVTPPRGAAFAQIYVQAHDGTEAWFDDVAFRRVEVSAAVEVPSPAVRSLTD